MRICGACRRPLRRDESLATLFCADDRRCPPGGVGAYQACPRCVEAYTGVPAPPPQTYPASPDLNLPPYIHICGLCREALFEDELGDHLRLQAEDVKGTDTEAGHYSACPRCIEAWRPVLHARYIRDGIVPPGTPLEALQGAVLG